VTIAAVILAGGKGTRSADPSQAKLGQVIGGKSLMQWHLDLLMDSEIDEVIVVAGHLGEQVQQICSSVNRQGMNISVIHEKEQKGTVPALRLASEESQADEFLVILGDILMAFDVDAFMEHWRASGKQVGVAVHPSTHPQDSDAAFPSHDGTVKVVPKDSDRSAVPNMSSAGLFAITRGGFDEYADCRDFGSQILPEAAASNDLYADVNSYYFKDTGTPDRLAAATRDFDSGAFARRGARQKRSAVFLDRDGVINPALPEIYQPEKFTLNDGVGEAIRAANQKGIPVFVVTNQPGIAKGFMTFAGHESIRAQLDHLLTDHGAFVDDYVFCPHHPESGFPGEREELKISCSCRKPEPGMLLEIAERHGIDLATSVMIGDTNRDAGAAQGAGTAFLHTEDFPDVGPSGAILRAIEVVTC
jgi:histidinol-phosphate phosphatase family protein